MRVSTRRAIARTRRMRAVSIAAARCARFGLTSSAAAVGVARPQVGDEVGDGEVGFVTDATHDRDRRSSNGPRHPLVIECPKILDAAPAAAHHQHVALRALPSDANRAGNALGGPVSLDRSGIDHDRDAGHAAREGGEEIPQRRGFARGGDTDRTGPRWQRTFALGIEEPLALELRLQPLERFVQGSEPGRAESFDVELELAAGFVQRDEGEELNLRTVPGKPVELLGTLPKEDATHLGIPILQGEITVTRAVAHETRHLAAHPEQGQAALQRGARFPVQLGHREHP